MFINRPLSAKPLCRLFTISLLLLLFPSAVAASDPVTAEISVTGTVTLNGQAVISSTTIVSGNVIETGTGSAAAVSLGKRGKIEISESSKLTLNFSEAGMDGFLSHGEAKIYAPSGQTLEFTTKDVTVVAAPTQENSFRLLVECAHTHVEALAGPVTMKRDETDEIVLPGEEKVAGDISKADCPVCIVSHKKKPSVLPGVIGAGIAGIITAVIGNGGGNNPAGPGVNVSPIRP